VVSVLGPLDVGHRVVVRRRAGHHGDRSLLTDALGELAAITDTDLTVVTRTGPVTIARSDVVAAKRVPPRPVTRRQIAALEAAANEAWPAPVQQALGQWLLRAADGWSNRANSALATGDPGLPLAAAVDAVERWYREHSLPPAVTVPLPAAARVEAHLQGRGWQPATPVLVQTAPLAVVRGQREAPAAPGPEPATGSERQPVRLLPAPTGAWLALAASPHGRAAPGPLPPAALRVLTTEGRMPVRFAHVHDPDGDLVAAGRGTLTGAGRWLGLSRMVVAPPARRRGLARQVVAALVDWAGQEGATDAFLQVEEDNAAAIGLYADLGFRPHHSYVTWRQPRTGRRGRVDRACA
jgi:N-acetylglutamate synthase